MTETQTEQTQSQTYAPGTPIWADLAAPDAAAARSFYTSLFGWDVSVSSDPNFGGYGMFIQDGKQVAGVGPGMDSSHPAFWTTYMLSESADESAAKVTEAGGQVVMGPVDVGPNGRMAIAVDPAGAFFGVWQAGEHTGADLFNTPVSVTWNELHSRNLEASSRFYEAVFGWESDTSDLGGMPYTQWKIDGRGIAGGMPMDPAMPAEVPSHWLVYFAVQDCDSMVARAQELGASVIQAPFDIPGMGRFAVLSDPQSAVFAVADM